jgi:hypothetical protein
MRTLLFVISISIISCNQKSSNTEKRSRIDSIFYHVNFDTTKSYSEPCCLQYKGKPLLTIGQNLKQLDTTFSFRYDPNGQYEEYGSIVTDYLSLDDFFFTKDTAGSIGGIIFFSADKKGRIFNLSCRWTLDPDCADASGMEAMNILNKYFSCLPTDLKGRLKFEIPHKDFTEIFMLYPHTDGIITGNGRSPRSLLEYSVSLRK